LLRGYVTPQDPQRQDSNGATQAFQAELGQVEATQPREFVATFRSESWTIAVGTLYKFEVL